MNNAQVPNGENEAATASTSVLIVDETGTRGYADRHTLQKVRQEPGNQKIAVQFGEHVALVDVDALIPQGDDAYRLPIRLDDLQVDTTTNAAAGASLNAERELGKAYADEVIPVLAEQLHVEKRRVDVGRVRVVKRVHERDEEVDVPLLHEEVQIERVSINEFVDEAPETRREGDTLILPVMEEVLVVEKRLRLKEEIHITAREFETLKTARATLREEEIAIEREPIDPS